MASAGTSAVRIIDSDNEVATVTDNRLDVNATLVAGTSIDIGDVDIHLSGNVPLLGNAGDVAAGVLRVTLANDDPAVASLQLLDNAIDGNQMQVDIIADSNLYTLGTNAYLEGTTTGRVAGAVRNNVLAALAGTDNEIAPLQVDTQGALYTTHGMTGMTHGTNNDVDTTAEQLDGSTSGLDTACKRVDLMANHANTGSIYVGGSDTIGALTGGIELRAGDFYSIDINNLNDIWIEASENNQILKYIYFT